MILEKFEIMMEDWGTAADCVFVCVCWVVENCVDEPTGEQILFMMIFCVL